MRGSLTAALCVCITAIVGAGTACASDRMADKVRTVKTDDGWHLRVHTTEETLDRVPNLAGTPFTREGFVTLKAIADVTGSGHQAVNAGKLSFGYQIGCQIDMSNGIYLGLSAAIGPNVGITVAPTPGLNVGGSALAVPSISITPKPGTITDISFGSKPLAGRHASMRAEQVQIKVDACAGHVTLRSYASVSMSTATSDDAVSVYGDPITL